MTTHPQLAGRTCYHKFEITPGFHTPGTFLDVNPKICLDELGIPQNLAGLRVLDIGAWDGAFTFELARRGAEVTALDIQDPDITVFNAVRSILKSSVNYVRCSVYDLNKAAHGMFDLVLFAGVYYHLKSPVLALQRIREVLPDTGHLYIEGASCSVYLAKVMARQVPGSDAEHLVNVIDQLPISLFDTENRIYPHWSNWWFPTSACLRAMLSDSGFHNIQLGLAPSGFTSYVDLRLKGRALADPGKSQPGAQHHEHEVVEKEFISDRLPWWWH